MLRDTLSSIHNKIYYSHCCYMCTLMYMISKTEKSQLHLLHVPDNFYVIKWILQEWGYWIVAIYEWKRSFMIFVPKNFSISISFSTFMVPNQHFTCNEFVIFHWLLVCSITYSVSLARLDGIVRNNVKNHCWLSFVVQLELMFQVSFIYHMKITFDLLCLIFLW